MRCVGCVGLELVACVDAVLVGVFGVFCLVVVWFYFGLYWVGRCLVFLLVGFVGLFGFVFVAA